MLTLCLSLFLFACDDDGDKGGEGDGTGAGEQPPAHGYTGYLEFEKEDVKFEFTESTRYKGEVVGYSPANNLIAVLEEQLDKYNKVVKYVKVYDVTDEDDSPLMSVSVSYPLNGLEDERKSVKVVFDYPIIEVLTQSYNEDGEPEYYAQYHPYNSSNTLLYSRPDSFELNNYTLTKYGNSLYSLKTDKEGKITWFDGDMNTIRTIDGIAANYDVTSFESECDGYLYNLESDRVQVFNKQGICSAVYEKTTEGILKSFVLDSGDVLIQDYEEVDLYTACDFELGGKRYKVNSLVLDEVKGTVTEKTLDYAVLELDTKYEQDFGHKTSIAPKLAKDKDNKAVIYRFGAGNLSVIQELAVIDNDLKIEYSLKNPTKGVDLTAMTIVSDSLYIAPVTEGGANQEYIFDLEGNKVAPYTIGSSYDTALRGNYIVSDNAVYDQSMNLVYDFTTDKYEGSYAAFDATNGKIYLSKYNFEMGARETYVYDIATKAEKLLCDGLELTFGEAYDGIYVVTDKDGYQTIYDTATGEAKASYHIGSVRGMYLYEDALAIAIYFDGKYEVCVIR